MIPGGLGPVGLGVAAHTVSSNTSTIVRNSSNSHGYVSEKTLEEIEREQEEEMEKRITEEMLEELITVTLFFLGLAGVALIIIIINLVLGYFVNNI